MKPLLSFLFILLPLSLLAAPGDPIVPGTNRPQVTLVWDANDPSEGVTVPGALVTPGNVTVTIQFKVP